MKKKNNGKIRQKWEKLSDKRKKQMIFGGIGCLLLIFCVCVGTGVSIHMKRSNVPISEEAISDTFEESNSAGDFGDSLELVSSESSDDAQNTGTDTVGKDTSDTKATVSKDEGNGKTNAQGKSNVTYVTTGPALKINGEEVFMPSEAYVAVKRFLGNYAFRYTCLNTNSPYAYFEGEPLKNKAIELEKDFYWTAKTQKKLGISTGQLTLPAENNLTTDEEMARWRLADLSAANELIIKAYIENGTLTPRKEDKEARIRKACEACSSMQLVFDERISEARMEEEIAYAKSLFGKNGCPSAEEATRVSNILSERAAALKAETSGRYVSFSASYSPAVRFDRDGEWGVDASKYNVVQEDMNSSGGNKSYWLLIYYDPVEHLQLDAHSKDVLNREVVLSQYLALKKQEMSQYKIVIHTDAYEKAIARVK